MLGAIWLMILLSSVHTRRHNVRAHNARAHKMCSRCARMCSRCARMCSHCASTSSHCARTSSRSSSHTPDDTKESSIGQPAPSQTVLTNESRDCRAHEMCAHTMSSSVNRSSEIVLFCLVMRAHAHFMSSRCAREF